MVAGVETTVESADAGRVAGGRGLQLRLLGPMAVLRDGAAVRLPSSRKVRALIAYLALAPRAQTRSHLCELFGDIPSDPRGELRWCLSKARGVLDEPGRRRIATPDDSVELDLADAFVDVAEVDRALRGGIGALGRERLRALSELLGGEFLEGLEIERSPQFGAWLLGQRRRLRGCRVALLEQRVADRGLEPEERLACLEQWLRLAPFDRRAQGLMLAELARAGQLREGEEHLAATTRAFEAEGLDWRPLRDAWRQERARHLGAAATPRTPLSAEPTAALRAPGAAEAAEAARTAPRRASIAVMPFDERADATPPGGSLASGLVHDIITRLAKLRSLFVIAQGTVFALHERRIGAGEAGRTLDVDYVVGGSLRRQGERIAVNVELTETRTARVVWADAFNHRVGDAFMVLDEIGNRIVSSVASEVETLERERAVLKPPSSLDAWEAHHRGLWHMYRFNPADNEQARGFFEMAVRLDPTFARAHAGLSFTHFQNAFQGWAERAPAIERAYAAAGRSLAVDDRDPAAHWSMGRALWLRGQHDGALVELEQAVDLSPNFALGYYTLAFVQSQSGDPQAAIASSDQSRSLSPYDPLLFGMLATRAMALARLGRHDEAADWAVRAASRPNAHAHIQAIAVHCLALAGRHDEAARLAAAIRQARPGYGTDDFLAAFQFAPDAVRLFRGAGFDTLSSSPAVQPPKEST